MIPFRVIRSGLLLAGLLATLGSALRAADLGFTAGLTPEEQAAAGLPGLAPAELAALDRLVADDLARAQQLKTSALPGTLQSRHAEDRQKEAGLDRLTPEQLAKLNEFVDRTVYARPQPKERPRLKDSDVFTEEARLQVHGGMSFTYGWAGGGRSFRETAAWVSYYDPVTGIGLGFGFANYSGDGFYDYYPAGATGYDRGYYPVTAATTPARPRTSLVSADRPNTASVTRAFRGDGTSLRSLKGGGHRGRQ